jgi:arginyl-tRNA synthetase
LTHSFPIQEIRSHLFPKPQDRITTNLVRAYAIRPYRNTAKPMTESTPKIWLNCLKIPPNAEISSATIRYTYIDVLHNLFQQTHHFCTLDTNPNPSVNLQSFLQSLRDSSPIYQATVSRQMASDLPENVEETTFKDTPKTWYIQTANYGDDFDRPLQDSNGQPTQLLEDIARYHQQFKKGYQKVIVLRSYASTGYQTQLNAAMQCLGYSLEQFHFIPIQPLKIHAFHEPSQQLKEVGEMSQQDLIKAVGKDTLRWHSLASPLNEMASINLSIAGWQNPEDSLYRIQNACVQCSLFLEKAKQKSIIQLDRNDESILPKPLPLSEYKWDSKISDRLAQQIQLSPQILQQSAREIAPYLICRYLETTANLCHQSLESAPLTPQSCALFLAVKQTIVYLLETILNISTPELEKK